MSLTPFTSTITTTDLRANFDDATAQLTTNTTAGRKDQMRFVHRLGIDSAEDVSLRSITWEQPDDQALQLFMVTAIDGVGGPVITATLTQVDGGTEYLIDNTISLAVTSINGTATNRTDYRTTTGTRLRLRKGVRYKLTLTSDSATPITSAMAVIETRSIRREA